MTDDDRDFIREWCDDHPDQAEQSGISGALRLLTAADQGRDHLTRLERQEELRRERTERRATQRQQAKGHR